MLLLRSGLVLASCVTLVASLLVVLCMSVACWLQGWALWQPQFLLVPVGASLVTVPTITVLAIAASLGRRRPVLDGITLIVGVGLIVCSFLYFQGLKSPDVISRSFAWSFTVVLYMVGIAALVPAYLITYLALCRTPFLRGLAPARKTKGPAEASP